MLARFPQVKRRLKAFLVAGVTSILLLNAGVVAEAIPPVIENDTVEEISISPNDSVDSDLGEEGPQALPEDGTVDDQDIQDIDDSGEEMLDGDQLDHGELIADLDAALDNFALTQSGNELTLRWSVQEGGTPVGGATVEIQGPKLTNTSGSTTWGSITEVTDCVTGDCADSLDKNPNPGEFAINQRVVGTGGGYMEFEPGQIYRLRGAGSPPVGYNWHRASGEWTEMSQGAWAHGELNYEFSSALQLSPSPSISWQVTSGDAHVGGSVLNLEGPRQGNSDNWEHEVQVMDCVIEDGTACAAISMDQDPRPGYFKVHTLRWGTSSGFDTYSINTNEQYRVSPHDSPVGYAWNAPNTSKVANSSSYDSVKNTFDLGEFELTGAATIAWSISDSSGEPVGGSTFAVQTGTDNSYVTDCTHAPCHPEAMDQDPKPGKFKIDTLRGLAHDGYTQTAISVYANAPYNLTPTGIPGYSMENPTSVRIPADSSNLNREVASPFQVTGGRATSQLCTAPENSNSYYSLSDHSDKVLVKQFKHSGTGIETLSGTSLQSSEKLLNPGQKADALGLTPTGVFYFTGQNTSGNTQARNTTIYRFDPSVDKAPYPVFNMDLLSPTTGSVVSGDATIFEGREEFYFAYYSDSPANNAIRFHLYRYSHGHGPRTGEVHHIDVPKPENFASQMDGDFVLDSQNNLQFIISDARPGLSGQYISGVVRADLFQDDESSHELSTVRTILGTGQPSNVTGLSINGVAFTREGRAVIQQYQNSGKAQHSVATMPDLSNLQPRELKNESHLKDLASCSSPATITIQTELIGQRYHPEDQFTLTAYRQQGNEQQEFTGVTTTGTGSGTQQEQIGPFVITAEGQLHAAQKIVPSTDEESNYSTSWACYANNQTGGGGEPFRRGDGENLEFSFTGEQAPPEGSSVTCIFTTTTSQADLNITKTVNPSSNTSVSPEDELVYTVTLDNSGGTVAAVVDHTDHLEDLLDDAEFINPDNPGTPSIEVEQGQDLITEWIEKTKQINITGTVPARTKLEFSYRVQVLPNNQERTGEFAAYYLQSFITAQGAERPDSCSNDRGNNPTCTTNAINAWTIDHGSRPANGARLHAGGNAHYQLVARKLTPETPLEELVFTDDLTNVFKTAGFAPEAAVPGGALKRGIYFFDAEGYTLKQVDSPRTFAERNNQDDSANPIAAYEGIDWVPDPISQDGKWMLTSKPVTVPLNAIRAELWFAVQAGHHMDRPGQWEKDERGNPKTPRTGTKFTNYVTANANIPPARCATGFDIADLDFPAACQVTHELQDNYFTIRKDAQGPAVDAVNLRSADTVADSAYGADPTGIWNMIGHRFEIRDHNPNSGGPTDHPSRFLCRKDYDPRNATNWDSTTGEWVAGEAPAWNGQFEATAFDDEKQFDWEETSATMAAIQSWNNAHPQEEKQLPACGLIYEQGNIHNLAESTAGGQTGRWRSEHLPTGDYWLVETQAPTHQISTDGSKKREVPGIHPLAEPIPFTVWPDAPGAVQANHGLGQLDVSRDGSFGERWEERCIPGGNASKRPTACVNPTGYLLLVKDVSSITLPLSGGQWLMTITATGTVILILAGIGIFWWRRRE